MIVIPMAGMSSRFFKSGFKVPKYMLKAHGKTLFEHSVSSFQRYYRQQPFLFIVKDAFDTPSFVREQLEQIGIEEYYIVVLDQDTRGQAETVALGLEKLELNGKQHNGPITIFNIDTFRPNFILPEVSNHCDGYLEVFKGSGSNWSFAKPTKIGSTLVSQTAEKNPISDLCSTGLYYFKTIKDYLESYETYISRPESEWEKGEVYIAPLYNDMISRGLDIHYHLIEKDEVIFCGTPEEYSDFIGES